jgi:hypothetical protein
MGGGALLGAGGTEAKQQGTEQLTKIGNTGVPCVSHFCNLVCPRPVVVGRKTSCLSKYLYQPSSVGGIGSTSHHRLVVLVLPVIIGWWYWFYQSSPAGGIRSTSHHQLGSVQNQFCGQLACPCTVLMAMDGRMSRVHG